MRLIDADRLYKRIKAEWNPYGKPSIEYASGLRVLDIIGKQPTAYDVDKVVEELEERSIVRANSKSFYDNPQKGEYVDEVVLLSTAIEIVKAGGNND